MASADHVSSTVGGVSSGSSPTITVASVLPPRIDPPYVPKTITSRPSPTAAKASVLAASCTPWPPMPVSNTSRSTAPPSAAWRHGKTAFFRCQSVLQLGPDLVEGVVAGVDRGLGAAAQRVEGKAGFPLAFDA